LHGADALTGRRAMHRRRPVRAGHRIALGCASRPRSSRHAPPVLPHPGSAAPARWLCAFSHGTPDARFDDGLTASRIFDDCLAAHGGDMRDYPGDLNLSTDGHWHALIQRIQPVISDAGVSIISEERYRPRDGLYAVHHHGPLGDKQVIRTPAGITVYYNGVRETDPVKLRATALTNDAFALFHFGPSFIKARATAISRLPDASEDGQRYYRLLATLSPGFGEA
jgi:hypothetical protein